MIKINPTFWNVFVVVLVFAGIEKIACAQPIRLGVSPHILPSQPATPESLEIQVAQLASLGVNTFYSSRLWSDLEPMPGIYNVNSLDQDLERYWNHNMSRGLFTLRIPDTFVSGLPEALAGRAWNDPELLARATALIDQLGPHLAGVKYFSIGNEVDQYFHSRPEEVAAFEIFHRTLKDRLKLWRPDLKIGFTLTAFGVIDEETSEALAGLHAQSDFLAVTYYPLNSNFSGRDPATVLTELAFVRTAAVNLGILEVAIQEAGYPSSAFLGNSPQMQADFVRNVFQVVLDDPGPFVMLNFFLQANFSEAEADNVLEHYGTIEYPEEFKAYLQSLGLYFDDGTPKPAVAELVAGIEAVKGLTANAAKPCTWLCYQ